MPAMSEQVALLTEQIAAVMAHNGITSPAEAFLFFDIDQDDKISVADLFQACNEVQIPVSERVVSDWIAHHAQDDHHDRSSLSPDAWHAALQHADGNTVLKRLAEESARPKEFSSQDGEQGEFEREISATDSEYQRMRDEQEQVIRDMKLAQAAETHPPSTVDSKFGGTFAEQQDTSVREKTLTVQLQKVDALLATEQTKVKGSLNGGEESSSIFSSSSVASSPPESAGSGEEFEISTPTPVRAERGLSVEGKVLEPSEASAILQAVARRSFLARHGFWKEEIDRKHGEAKMRWRSREEKAAIKIQARARGIAARQLRVSVQEQRVHAMPSRKSTPNMVDDETVALMKQNHVAAIRIQARQRGLRDRQRVRELRQEQLNASSALLHSSSRARTPATPSKTASGTYSDNDFEDDYDDEFENEDEPSWHGPESVAAAIYLQAVCRARMSARDLELLRTRNMVEDSLETIERQRAEKRSAEQLKLELLRKERTSGSDVLAVQIDMIEADWAAADRHKRVLKYATERLARSIVNDLIDSTVERQEISRAKRERARILHEEEQNRGYRKPRVVDAITEHIKNSALEEIRLQQQFHVETNRWYKQRGKALQAFQEQEEDCDVQQAQKTAEYIATRRAKVDKIYQEREKDKLLKQQQVAALKESRKLETTKLVEFVSRQKSLEEERVEQALKCQAGCVNGKSSTGMQRASALMLTERQELKAMVALDAQRRNQMILAQVHKERMIAEKEKMHELGVKMARRKVLKQEKQEQEFQKRAQKLVKQKEKRNELRKAKREQLMTLYESALQAAEDLKKSQPISSIRGYVD